MGTPRYSPSTRTRHGRRHDFGADRRHGSGRFCRRFPVEEPRADDADLIENVHRQRHKTLIEGIRSGGQNGGDDEGAQQGPFPVALQKWRINPAQLGHERNGQRHFENQSKHHQKPQRKPHVLRDRQLWNEAGAHSVRHEKIQRKRQDEEKGETDARIKRECAQHDKRPYEPALLRVKARHHKLPNLQQDVWRGEHKGKQAGHFDVLPQRFSRGQEDERHGRQVRGHPGERTGHEHVLEGNTQPLDECVCVEKRPDEDDGRRDDCPRKPDLELDQMLHDRHFLIFQRLKDGILQPPIKIVQHCAPSRVAARRHYPRAVP